MTLAAPTDVTFDGVALSTAVPAALVTRVRRGLLGARRDVYTEVPGRSGSWLFPDQPGDRSLVVSVNILADTNALRRSAVNDLAGWADSDTGAQLIVDDEPTRYWDAKLVGPDDPDEWLLSADLDLEFRTGPYAKATAISSETWTASTTAAHTFTMTGDVTVQPVYEITAGAGAITSLLVATNGRTLVLGGGIAAAGIITVNGISYMVTTGANADTALVGYFNAANVNMGQVSGTFPTLNPGSNSVVVTTTPSGRSVTVVARWRRLYRG